MTIPIKTIKEKNKYMKPNDIIAICEYILDKTRNDDNPTPAMLSDLIYTLNQIEKDLAVIKSQLNYTPQMEIELDSDDLPF